MRTRGGKVVCTDRPGRPQRAGLQRAVLGLVAALFIVIAGCGIDSLDKLASGDVDCYPSFRAFKRAMEQAGKKPPSSKQWHHIVNQNASNRARFGERLHCTDNVIAIPTEIHRQISGHYSKKFEWTKGKTVRDKLKSRSWDAQYDYGVRLLREFGIDPP